MTMHYATTDTISGYKTIQALGLVRGNTVRARNVGRDIVAAFRNMVGGEITEYTKLLSESRDQALHRMGAQAEQLGANAVVGIRFTTSQIMTNAAEIMAFGTAVFVEPE